MIEVKGIDPKMIANNIDPYEPAHPGELIKDEIEFRGISQKKLADRMGASYTVVNDIINCKRAVNPQYALLFEAALGIPAHILTGLQADFDMLNAKRNQAFAKRLENIRKVAALL